MWTQNPAQRSSLPSARPSDGSSSTIQMGESAVGIGGVIGDIGAGIGSNYLTGKQILEVRKYVEIRIAFVNFCNVWRISRFFRMPPPKLPTLRAVSKNSVHPKSVSELGLSLRVANRLLAANVATVEALAKLSIEELRKVRNIGTNGLAEILQRLSAHDIHLLERSPNSTTHLLPGRRSGIHRRGYPFMKLQET